MKVKDIIFYFSIDESKRSYLAYMCLGCNFIIHQAQASLCDGICMGPITLFLLTIILLLLPFGLAL